MASPILSPKRATLTSPILPRKRFKSSELPLTQGQHSAIDSLIHIFKKKGEFDVIRKQVYAKFEDNEAKERLANALTELADVEFERNPSLLSKDRRQAAPLIEGAAERSEIYRTAEADVDKLIDQYLVIAEVKIREARRDDVGVEIAAEEEQKGRKTDAEYALEAEVRRRARAKIREEEMAKERERVREEKRKAEEERRRQQEEAERLEQEKLEREEQERKKREAEREAYEKEMEERRERKKRQDAEWERERIEREEKERLKREKEREKQIEEDALNELLREGQALAAKSKPDRLDEYDSSSRRASHSKRSPAKEPAIAAIMRAEKLENEAKSGKPETLKTPKPVFERPGSSMTWKREVDGKDAKPHFKPSIQTEQRPHLVPHSPSEQSSRSMYESKQSSDDYYKTRPSYESSSRSIRHQDDPHETDTYRRSTGDVRSSEYHNGHSSPHPAERTSSSRSHSYRDDRHGYSESRRDDRSRSPRHSHSYKEKDERSKYRLRSNSPDPPRRRRSRSRDPPDIDRYVPSSSSRSSHRDRDRDRDRDDERYHRDSEYGRDRERRRTDRTRDSDRHRDSERDYSRQKDKPKTKTPVEIDRYVPPGSSRKSIQEEEDRKARKRELS